MSKDRSVLRPVVGDAPLPEMRWTLLGGFAVVAVLLNVWLVDRFEEGTPHTPLVRGAFHPSPDEDGFPFPPD